MVHTAVGRTSFALVTLGAAAALATACGGAPSAKNDGAAGAQGEAGVAGGAAGGRAAGAGGAPDAASGAGGSTDAGVAGAPSSRPSAMPLISRNVPAFASGSANSNVLPARSNDDQTGSTWGADKLPAWLAYDLSGVPVAQRHQILIAFYCPHAGGYILDNKNPGDASPIDYMLDINAAPGGGPPPTAGWKNVANEVGNTRSARQHLTDLAGDNWVRMTVTKATNPAGASFDFDVHSAPDGASDSWLLMGDSITHISTMYAFSDLPSLVRARSADRWPAVISAAIGGTNTSTALPVIDETMKDFPGRFVWLAYGTNDHANEFAMEPLVQKVLAAGKIPVIPHVPWSSSPGIQTDGPLINNAIDALYIKYPQILRGPDLWAAFKDRPDLIPAGDVHPNGAGQEELRQRWATAMTP